MSIEKCVEFANKNPLCYLATVEGNQPRVRAMGFWFADETGFYLQSGSMKELHKQILDNPNAEICFYEAGQGAGTMLRVSGKADLVTERELKEKAINDRPFLKDFGLTADSPELSIYRIAHGTAHFWTWENNLTPKHIIEF